MSDRYEDALRAFEQVAPPDLWEEAVRRAGADRGDDLHDEVGEPSAARGVEPEGTAAPDSTEDVGSPSGFSVVPLRPGRRSDRSWRAVAAAAVAMFLAVALVAVAASYLARSDDGSGTTTIDDPDRLAPDPTAPDRGPRPTTPQTFPPTTVAPDQDDEETLPETEGEEAVPPEPEDPGLPGGAEEYAGAAYEAWTVGDRTELERLSGGWIAHFLSSRGSGGAAPGASSSCEATGRSTWCVWSLTDGSQLALQVDNEFADRALSEAVIGAEIRAGGRVGVFPPVVDQEDADERQDRADSGEGDDSGWLTEARVVVEYYAQEVLGWAGTDVVGEDSAMYTVTDPATGVSIFVELSQPARSGEGGIWVVTMVGAGNPAAEDPRDLP